MFSTGLQPYASTRHGDKCWSTPTRRSPTAHDAPAMLTANDEPAFSQPWDYSDALSLLQQRRWNLMRGCHGLHGLGRGGYFFCGVCCPDQRARDRYTYE